jgi:hypothetical protein
MTFKTKNDVDVSDFGLEEAGGNKRQEWLIYYRE